MPTSPMTPGVSWLRITISAPDERRLDRDAVDQHEARAALLEERAFDPALALARVQLDRQQVGEAARAGAARLDHVDAALGGEAPGVDQRDAAREHAA